MSSLSYQSTNPTDGHAALGVVDDLKIAVKYLQKKKPDSNIPKVTKIVGGLFSSKK